MIRLCAITLMAIILAGCVNGDNWRINASTTEPIKDKCEKVIFGENSCAHSDRDKVSEKDKTVRFEEPLDLVPYIGLNAGISW